MLVNMAGISHQLRSLIDTPNIEAPGLNRNDDHLCHCESRAKASGIASTNVDHNTCVLEGQLSSLVADGLSMQRYSCIARFPITLRTAQLGKSHRRSLLVPIDEECVMPFPRECYHKVNGQRGLADATFYISNREDHGGFRSDFLNDGA